MTKDRVFSGIQPSGSLTIGNYLGALKNFKNEEKEFQPIYCIVDMHALTTLRDPQLLKKNSLELLALYLASGLDPDKSIIFLQSHVRAHAELAWVLNTISPLGQLQRMTQYKDKAKDHTENLYAGLLNYPILMAADIILYDAKYVPVGEDQKQHLEFTRDIAEKFNYMYGQTFVIPEFKQTKQASRIMSLQDPNSKMSKSSDDENSFILILDDPKQIEKKIMRSVTDSKNQIKYTDEQAGIKNLIEIYSGFTSKSPEEIVSLYEDKGYGDFKKDLAQVVIEGLRPIQDKYNTYINDKAELEKIYTAGAKKASSIADKKIQEVYDKIGFIQA